MSRSRSAVSKRRTGLAPGAEGGVARELVASRGSVRTRPASSTWLNHARADRVAEGDGRPSWAALRRSGRGVVLSVHPSVRFTIEEAARPRKLRPSAGAARPAGRAVAGVPMCDRSGDTCCHSSKLRSSTKLGAWRARPRPACGQEEARGTGDARTSPVERQTAAKRAREM